MKMDRGVHTAKLFCKGFRYYTPSSSILDDDGQYHLPPIDSIYSNSKSYGGASHLPSESRGKELTYFVQEYLGKSPISSDFLYFILD